MLIEGVCEYPPPSFLRMQVKGFNLHDKFIV